MTVSSTEPVDPDPRSHTPTASLVVVQPGGPVHGKIRPPGSKSLTNRALVCAAFADGESVLSGTLVSEDTEVMIASLEKIGVQVGRSLGGRELRVIGCGAPGNSRGPATEPLDLFIANSGTTIRFLTAALSARGGNFRLSGVPRMHARPIGDLTDALRPIFNGRIEPISPGGCPPVVIDGSGWSGNTVRVAGNVSSQFLSGLMMAAPVALRSRDQADGCLTVEVVGELVSLPYVSMTAELMRSFGAEVVKTSGGKRYEISGRYSGQNHDVEPDASAASYFWAAAAITGGKVTVCGLSRHAMQGDVGFVDVLQKMGCDVELGADRITVIGKPLCGIDVNMNAISDTVQTLAVVALFAKGPTRVRGVAHNRFKETDRIGDLACELRKLGTRIDEHEDGLTIHPLDCDALPPAVQFQTYDDHRMAMSLALVGLRLPSVAIENPACTRKTYPEFWADLEQLTGRPHQWRSTEESEPCPFW